MTTRYYLWLAAGATVLLLLGVLLLAIEGQRDTSALHGGIQVVQVREARLAELMNQLTTAEAAQRGFLLTNEPKYLQSYSRSFDLVESILAGLTESYRLNVGRTAADQRADMARLHTLVGGKLAEMTATLALYAKSGPEGAMALVRTDIGLETINRIRALVADINDREQASARQILQQVDRNARRSFLYLALTTFTNILLVAGAAFLLDRDLRRQDITTNTLELHADDLERQVRARTAELSTLSSHLQHVAETEKAALARELHDELGGLLVAAKMDVSWLEKRVADAAEPANQLRWKRIRDALDQGVDLKRRIVENLRPTLLDNMGLVPALQWVLQETCGRAGLKCTDIYPSREIHLADDASIKVFRLVQEALTNIVKHARASQVLLELAIDGESLVVRIVDNGVGVEASRQPRGGFHGLASMRHRVTSVGGSWELKSPPGGGTEILARLPLARIVAGAGAG